MLTDEAALNVSMTLSWNRASYALSKNGKGAVDCFFVTLEIRRPRGVAEKEKASSYRNSARPSPFVGL